MTKPNLPVLPENYRWRIEKNDYRASIDAVNIYLEKEIQHWWGDTWRPLYQELVRKPPYNEIVSLAALVEERASKMYDQEFGNTESAKIEGIYYGSD